MTISYQVCSIVNPRFSGCEEYQYAVRYVSDSINVCETVSIV